ncbi:MAG TPA: Fic family protein [Leptospiraceae bacterium]|nr:Fic family protein [Leptospiraceae bacterium]HNN04245.1 Fic family protein [Leptospiraceae bacterium]
MSPSKTHSFISFKKSWDLSEDSYFLLGQCKSLIKAISSTPLMPSYRQVIYSVNLIKGALATTAIEGNTLSEEEIKMIHEGKSLSISKQYMEIEVKNVLDALNLLRDSIVLQGQSQLITPDLIKDFHKMIGKNLGTNFEAVPGEFRKNNVTVGNYRAPDHSEVETLMKNFCEWSRSEFHFEKDQTFSTAIIQAIVSHIYIAWVHPFGDGNGRTARLLEFYLLLRAGVPDIAAHILSNFYNNTRNEYYRQLSETSKLNGNLTNFIMYALQGFKDGLQEVFTLVNQNQLELAWRNFVNEVFRSNNQFGKTGSVSRRILGLVLSMDLSKEYSLQEISEINEAVRLNYFNKSKRTLTRDIDALVEFKVVRKLENDKYKANSEILIGSMPASVKGKNIL